MGTAWLNVNASLSQKILDCNENQRMFEATFCAWKKANQRACPFFVDCVERAEVHYNETVARVMQSVENRKSAYRQGVKTSRILSCALQLQCDFGQPIDDSMYNLETPAFPE